MLSKYAVYLVLKTDSGLSSSRTCVCSKPCCSDNMRNISELSLKEISSGVWMKFCNLDRVQQSHYLDDRVVQLLLSHIV